MVTLTRLPAADATEWQLAQADARFLAEHGPERGWQPCQRELYEAAIAAIHARHAKRVTA